MYITITLKNGKIIKGILTGISKTHIEINHGEFIPISMLKQDFLYKLQKLCRAILLWRTILYRQKQFLTVCAADKLIVLDMSIRRVCPYAYKFLYDTKAQLMHF